MGPHGGSFRYWITSGQRPDRFASEHFSKIGKREPQANRGEVKYSHREPTRKAINRASAYIYRPTSICQLLSHTRQLQTWKFTGRMPFGQVDSGLSQNRRQSARLSQDKSPIRDRKRASGSIQPWWWSVAAPARNNLRNWPGHPTSFIPFAVPPPRPLRSHKSGSLITVEAPNQSYHYRQNGSCWSVGAGYPRQVRVASFFRLL